MATINTRATGAGTSGVTVTVLNRPLTNAEVDNNFINLAVDTNLALSTSGVTAGTYGHANIIVDAKGRVTSASNGVFAGDVLGTSGNNGTASLVLATSGVSAGTYGSATIIVDAKGRVTSASASVFSGDVTGTSGANGTSTLTLANSGVSAGTYGVATVVVDAKGRVTSASAGTASPGFTGTATFVGATISNAPTSGTDIVNKTYADGGTATITNKRLTPRISLLTSSTSNYTINVQADLFDIVEFSSTASAGPLIIANPTTSGIAGLGSLVNGQKLIYKIKSVAAQTINAVSGWGSQFQGSTDVPLPTVTSGNSKWDYFGFIYNSTDFKWQLVAKVAGF
jgi:hypothetical protein